MTTENVDAFWSRIAPLLKEDDDAILWRLAVQHVLFELEADYAWDDVPMPDCLHLVLAKQPHWSRPHRDWPIMYGRKVKGLGVFEQPPDWELHWHRAEQSAVWEFLGGPGSAIQPRNTSWCGTFFPGHTVRHAKVSIVQLWRPSISPGLPATGAKLARLGKGWYPEGRRYIFERNRVGEWSRIV